MENYLSGSSSKGISIHSSDLDEEDIKFYIEFLGKYFVAIPNNLEAVQLVEKWYKEYFDNGKKEILNELLTIIEDKNNFILIDEKMEAYKQFCERTNIIPKESLDLLQKRFERRFVFDKERFIESRLEVNEEILNRFEIMFINKEIELIKGIYYPIFNPNPINKIPPRMAQKTRGTYDLINVDLYIEWLGKRIEILSHKKINTNNSQQDSNSKLKWLSSASHFGFIINELINKGYFENLPMHFGEVNYSEIARNFNSIINFETSEQNLQKSFNPNNEKISETVKSKFTIPEFKDIKPKNSTSKGSKKQFVKTPIKPKEKK